MNVPNISHRMKYVSMAFALVISFAIASSNSKAQQPNSNGMSAKSVCERSAGVRDAIVKALGDKDCATITTSDLATISTLYVRIDPGQDTLHAKDFLDLRSLNYLQITNWTGEPITVMSAVFADVPHLETLSFYRGDFHHDYFFLDKGAFEGLIGLKSLHFCELGDWVDQSELDLLKPALQNQLPALEDIAMCNLFTGPGGIMNLADLKLGQTYTAYSSQRAYSCEGARAAVVESIKAQIYDQFNGYGHLCQLLNGSLSVSPISVSQCRPDASTFVRASGSANVVCSR